jgi:hypothetical protein
VSKWVICASGPSMASVDLDLLRRFRSWQVMAVNCTFRLVPWAAAMYAGDLQWWERYGAETAAFAGEKWTWDGMAAVRHKLRRVARRDGKGLCRARGAVNSGGNSGYQAVNLAYHFGARQIVLLGFDMHRNEGGHWHGEHEGMLSAPALHMLAWRREFEPLALDLRHAGVQVLNATEGTALTCFPMVPLAEALRA